MSTGMLAIVVLACGAGTYFWRALGVLLSGKVRTDSALFEWVGCVAYAMIAGLVVRIILMPSGTLAGVPLGYRLVACAIGLAVHIATRRNIFFGVAAGFFSIVTLTLLLDAR